MPVNQCPSCNSPTPPGAVFCDNCGFDLRIAAPAPVPPTYQVSDSANGIPCPQCGHENILDAVFCEDCGTKLKRPATPKSPAAPTPPVEAPPAPIAQPEQSAAPPPEAVPEQAFQPPVEPEAAALASAKRGRFELPQANITLPFPQGKAAFILGREDPVSGVFPEFDLEPYGAQEDGVGRKHAQITLQGGQVFIEDLNSVNGTMVNRQRIPAKQPHPLQDGDEVRLGKMVLNYRAG